MHLLLQMLIAALLKPSRCCVELVCPVGSSPLVRPVRYRRGVGLGIDVNCCSDGDDTLLFF